MSLYARPYMHKVLTGSEEPGVSPAGINYTVSWTTDENGQLVVNDTVEDEARTLAVTVPPPALFPQAVPRERGDRDPLPAGSGRTSTDSSDRIPSPEERPEERPGSSTTSRGKPLAPVPGEGAAASS